MLLHRRSLQFSEQRATDKAGWISLYSERTNANRDARKRIERRLVWHKRKKKAAEAVQFRRLVYATAAISVVLAFWRWFYSGRLYWDDKIEKNRQLYDRVYSLSAKNNLANGIRRRPILAKGAMRPSGTLDSVYGTSIGSCSLTVLLMDPRLGDPSFGPDQAAWFALESVAAFAPNDSCVLLLTSSCAMEDFLAERKENGRSHPGDSRPKAEQSVRNAVYDNSLPLFRNLIEQGRVRLDFLDHAKYHLHSCSDFGNPTGAFVNLDFWKNEFIDSVDSELVLNIQDDSVLCQPMVNFFSQYKNYAYVGAVWPREATKLAPFPREGMCRGMPARWQSWLLPQRRWQRYQRKNPEANQAVKPNQLLETIFPTVCENGLGPIGNGGLSLRNRTWLVRAIETCPHVRYSGLETQGAPLACKVLDEINEDFYFSVVLRGLGAPLPDAVKASLFSAEVLFPEDTMRMYGLPEDLQKEAFLGQRKVSFAGKTLTIPLGLHKPFWYHPNGLLLSNEMNHACPLLRYIFEPQMSRWQEFAPEATWVGIGT